jgi:ATP-dependent DNA helicase RecG
MDASRESQDRLSGSTDQIAVLEIEPSERAHENVRGETYLRVGDENRRLSALEAQELRYDKGESSFDGTPVEARLADLDATLVERYRRRLRAATTTESVLEARGLAVDREGELRPTIAGLLLLGSHPQLALPEASVRLLRYSGSSRETGARANVLADHRLDGSITAQVQAARRYLRRWLPQATRLESAGRFATSTVIPEVVWLEAIVNAVTHRSYSIGGDHIRIELFEDRLEVESPGRLPGLVRLENIRSTRFARNPRIARGMSEFGYGRELGEGVDRMFEEMSRVGLSDPVFTQGPASVRVILLADPIARRVLDRLPAGSEKLVEHLSRTGRVTTTQATELLRSSRPTALKYLRELQRAGLIVHVGTSLKDPRGFWRLERGVGDG